MNNEVITEELSRANRKGVNVGVVIGLIVILGAMAFAAFSFKGSLTPSVSFADAKKSDNGVQIVGSPQAGSLYYDDFEKGVHVVLVSDDGATMQVIFRGPKPEDLETAMSKATKITAMGTFDHLSKQFYAEKLLVKCPSKYKGKDPGDRSYTATPDKGT